MKPNFALGLTEDGITLWQRDGTGWLRVGAVPMGADDMDAQMQALVAKARALAPDGIATKLVIPDDQILYTDMPTQQDDQAIRAALEGKTPYPVEELDFDWQKSDGNLRVAVVAQETLIEAEEFARAQGLNPVCFVAAPQSDSFATEPFFGRVDGVSDSPEALGRNGPILRETGLAKLDKPTPEPAAKTKPAPVASPEKKTPSPKAEPAPPSVAKDKPATTPAKATKPVAKPEPDKPDSGKRNLSGDTSKATKPGAAKAPTVPVKAPATEKAKDEDAAAPASFRSRRATPVTPPAAPANKALTALAKSRSLSLGSLGGAILAERLRTSVTTPVSRATSSLRSATSLLKSKTLSESKAATPAQAELTRADASKPAPKAPAQAAQPAKPASTAGSAPAKPAADTEAERLTVFGARRNDTVSEPTLPRRALAISGAALLLVLAVVVWVFYFTSNQEPELAQPVLPEDAAGDIATPEALALPGREQEDPVEAALGVTDAAQQQGSNESVESTAPESITPDSTAPADDAPAQSAGRLAALRSVRAIAPSAPGDLPSVQGAPAPFGTAPLPPLRGAELPQVTDDEALAATGPILPPGEESLEISVTQGRPAAVPPARPEGLAPEPEPEPEPQAEVVAPQDESAVVVDVTEGAPPSVPPTRPEDIAPEPPANGETGPDDEPDAETPDDQASLSPPPGGVALTLLAPRSRPAEIVERAIAQTEQFSSATSQAVAASLRPSARPGAFSEIVERTLATARIRAVAEPQAEIVQASAVPRIPSSASVTRAATQTRAINLRQINLLGVMGTPSARRALVRLDNGRVVTIEVGERLDGGQVTAIGESELRYNKRGRDVVLRIAS